MSDTVKVGSLAVKNQFFLQVDKVTEQSTAPFGGILGLGHHRLGYQLNNSTRHTFIWSLFEEHPELPRQFSFFLSGFEDASPSQLVIGEPNVAAHAKEMIRYSKSANSYGVDTWLATMWSIGFSGGGWVIDFPDQGAAGVGALVDSGTSLIVLRPDIYSDMISELQKHMTGCGNTVIGFSCVCPPANNMSQLPSLVLAFVDDAGGLFSLCMTPEEYLTQSKDAYGGYRCAPTFQQGDMKQPTPVILGMTFMRSFYTTFDVAGQRIGFARSASSPVPAGLTCHIGFSIWRIINFEWVFFAGAFVLAILSGCLCGYFICPTDEEDPEVAEADLVESSQRLPNASAISGSIDAEEAEVETKGWCGYE
jgi:hypothetical protein